MLVIRGTADTIMVHPGQARYIEIDGMAHDFTVQGKFYDQTVLTILNWMKAQSPKM